MACVAAAALTGACASVTLAAAPAAAHSHAAGSRIGGHVVKVKDSAQLHLVHADGNTLVEQGHATGTLPGSVRVTLTLRSHKATSTFTLNARGGTISGSGVGSLKAGKSGWDSFGGSLDVRHGSGRFQHVHGNGGLYGAVYRVDDSMHAQVYGTLRY